MTFKIIKNAPPPPAKNAGRHTIYPFDEMEVGDAFDAPRDLGRSGKSDRRQNIITSASLSWRRRYNPNAKFSVRIIDENTVRCWRIA